MAPAVNDKSLYYYAMDLLEGIEKEKIETALLADKNLQLRLKHIKESMGKSEVHITGFDTFKQLVTKKCERINSQTTPVKKSFNKWMLLPALAAASIISIIFIPALFNTEQQFQQTWRIIGKNSFIKITGQTSNNFLKQGARVIIPGKDKTQFLYGKTSKISISGPAEIILEQATSGEKPSCSWNLKSGDIHVNITKDTFKEFNIKTPYNLIKVIGTSFHISVRPTYSIVKVSKGKVELQLHKTGKKEVLSKGETIVSTKEYFYKNSSKILKKKIKKSTPFVAVKKGTVFDYKKLYWGMSKKNAKKTMGKKPFQEGPLGKHKKQQQYKEIFEGYTGNLTLTFFEDKLAHLSLNFKFDSEQETMSFMKRLLASLESKFNKAPVKTSRKHGVFGTWDLHRTKVTLMLYKMKDKKTMILLMYNGKWDVWHRGLPYKKVK